MTVFPTAVAIMNDRGALKVVEFQVPVTESKMSSVDVGVPALSTPPAKYA